VNQREMLWELLGAIVMHQRSLPGFNSQMYTSRQREAIVLAARVSLGEPSLEPIRSDALRALLTESE